MSRLLRVVSLAEDTANIVSCHGSIVLLSERRHAETRMSSSTSLRLLRWLVELNRSAPYTRQEVHAELATLPVPASNQYPSVRQVLHRAGFIVVVPNHPLISRRVSV